MPLAQLLSWQMNFLIFLSSFLQSLVPFYSNLHFYQQPFLIFFHAHADSTEKCKSKMNFVSLFTLRKQVKIKSLMKQTVFFRIMKSSTERNSTDNKIQIDSEPSMCINIYFHFFIKMSFFFIYFYQLEANYFTILQWFLPYIDINQPWIYMCSSS